MACGSAPTHRVALLQIIPVGWLLSPGMHGGRIHSDARSTALSVYLQCRTVAYPRKPLLASDTSVRGVCASVVWAAFAAVLSSVWIIVQYPTQELFSPLYILLVPKVEIKLGTHNNICTATEMVEHVLHCAYAVCGRWLLVVATDAQGEYVKHGRSMPAMGSRRG